jgi:hypothetical protein
LVVIPSTSTKEKRQKGSPLICASGTRFSLHLRWSGKRSNNLVVAPRKEEEEEKVENALKIFFFLL